MLLLLIAGIKGTIHQIVTVSQFKKKWRIGRKILPVSAGGGKRWG
jgi:hypothetical protein